MYGEPIEITYKGEGVYKTKFGAAVSLVISLILLGYFGYKIYVMATYQATTVSSLAYVEDLNIVDEFSPSDVGFDFSFGLSIPLDPTLGSYSVNNVHYFYTGRNLSDGTQERNKTK